MKPLACGYSYSNQVANTYEDKHCGLFNEQLIVDVFLSAANLLLHGFL